MMAEQARNAGKYGGIAALVGLAVLAVGGLIYLSSKPQLAPTPPAPAVAAAPQVPVFDVVRVDPQGNVVLAGRAAPGAVVTIKSGNTVIGTATADPQGAFVLLPNNPLQPGAQEITLSETLPDGTVIAGTATASVDVPTGAGQALAVVSGPNGSQVLSGQGPKPGTLGMGTVDYDANGHAIFSGTAPAGAKVNVTLNGATVGNVVAGADGRWTFTATVPTQSGTLALNATDANGAVLPAVSAPFNLETLPNALAAGHIVITPGDNLWVIARNVYGHGNMYTLIYDANANQIHDPNLIYPSQVFALPKPKN
jgi:nucleoid-associated protein YgaU